MTDAQNSAWKVCKVILLCQWCVKYEDMCVGWLSEMCVGKGSSIIGV